MARKISTLKKAGHVVAVLAMLMPAVVFSNTFADCEGPEDLGQLQVLLDERNDNQNVTLCGDIDGQFTVYRRMTTINLNGHTISSGTEAFARVREQGQITITGTGNVNGRLSGGFNASSFIVQGGTWTADVSNYVSSPYAMYGEEGAYVVEPEITADNFIVSPSELSEGLFLHKGETGQITVTLPAGSTSGVTFTPKEESIVTVDANGVVTGVETDWTKVVVSPTYDPNIKKEIYVTVYAIEPTVDPEDEQYKGEVGAAANLDGLIGEAMAEMENGESEELVDKLTTAFDGGEDDAEDTIAYLWDAVYNGETINTKINKEQARLTDDERAEMVALMDGVSMDNVKFYDVTVDIEVEGGRIGGLYEMDKAIRVFIAETTDPEAGYIRKYYMVSYHNGEPELLEEGVDFEIVDGKIYLLSKRFSAFALGYKDVLAPVTYTVTAPETGVNTVAEDGASANTSVAVLSVIAAAILGSVAVLVKRK